ncbi:MULTISPECIES: acyl-CoA thioesterase [Gordonia]|uniref:Acyl-CoA thioesterase n=2 Tax=Gordonia TaxID=2053 RepID=L7LR40_9ACTN|nr:MULTISPECIES: thioesterase family protein [Gordonia]AUH67447.1 thioesterase family protein [Gordonia sp. YC-JH1]KJR09143.1 acyl-CoA thioesterase [Gordonia sihwensis]KXT55809.1 acyl-CoA thioesterase [Gordonia sp. QH-12]MBY4571859.1 acyl-CoA thioesterase [Gordonia sihwensis]WFN92906.1 thioesterase family protein [Gordonia sihwensis]
MTHVFDEAIALTPTASDHVVRAQTHPAYNNMVGPFGGITAATVVNGIQQRPDVLGDPLALTINYAAPIAEGQWDLDLRPVRTNRTNQHWVVTISQSGQVAATGTAVFGVARDTWSDTEPTPPAAPPAEEVEVSEYVDFIAWAKNYDKRFVAGGMDGRNDADSTSTLWLRDRPERPLDFPALTAMTDVFYPRVFLRHGTYMPAGTITLTTYFHATAQELEAHGTGHVLATARAARFGHGHFDQYGQLWSGEVLLATTHQLVYFKDPA